MRMCVVCMHVCVKSCTYAYLTILCVHRYPYSPYSPYMFVSRSFHRIDSCVACLSQAIPHELQSAQCQVLARHTMTDETMNKNETNYKTKRK